MSAGVLGVLTLPTWIAFVVALPLVVVSTAFALAGDVRRQVAVSSAVLVLAGSSGAVGSAAALAGERLVLTSAGIVVALCAAYLLRERSDR